MPVEDRLPDALHGLVALGARGDVNIRPVLVRVLTDMFVAKNHHSADEINQYCEIATQLLRNMDVDTCRIVAHKLARFENPPQSVLDLLVAKGGTPAEIILSQARGLGRSFLATEAVFGSGSNAAAIAARADLDRDLVAMLANRPETPVLHALAANPSAPIESSLFAFLVRRARTDAGLAKALIERAQSGDDLAPLFLVATPMDRAKIITSIRRRELGRPEPAPARPASPQTVATLEQLALAGERSRFILCLANALAVRPEQSAVLVDDAYGEPLALALAALRVPPHVAVRLFLFIDPRIGQSVERVRSLVRIVRHMPPHLCRRLLTAMMTGRTPTTYLPVTDADAAPAPSRPAPALTDLARGSAPALRRESS
jgi:Uncharacterised protein conserved in bacteria (DUF2336)